MRSMVEGSRARASPYEPRTFLTAPSTPGFAGGPPPRSGEE
jgi:hypothetical protein